MISSIIWGPVCCDGYTQPQVHYTSGVQFMNAAICNFPSSEHKTNLSAAYNSWKNEWMASETNM